jgi:hypothetical protein
MKYGIALLLALWAGPANAATWDITGVFATQTHDAVYCYPDCFVHSVTGVSVPLTGTIDISDTGLLTGFDLSSGFANYTPNSSSGILSDGSFFYYATSNPVYTELRFSFADGTLSGGLLQLWTDYDPWNNWEYKFTDLSGTAVDPVTTPLPATLPLFALGLALLSLLIRDNGQWAQNSPAIRQWFNTLQSKSGGLCCSFADGQTVDDPDWRNTPKGYQVFYKSVWMDVPPEAVVQVGNRVGHAVLWPVEAGYPQGTVIRCFMPGAEG